MGAKLQKAPVENNKMDRRLSNRAVSPAKLRRADVRKISTPRHKGTVCDVLK